MLLFTLVLLLGPIICAYKEIANNLKGWFDLNVVVCGSKNTCR